MNSREAERVFLEKEAGKLLAEKLAGLKEYQESHREEIAAGIMRSWERLLGWERQLAFRPRFIIYTLLRTELLENRGRYLIRTYDQNWYFGQSADFCWYDAAWGFRYFYEYWEGAESARRRYIGKVSAPFVQNMAMRTVMDFHRQIAESFLESREGLFSCREWQELEKKPELYLGEYMGSLIPVMEES